MPRHPAKTGPLMLRCLWVACLGAASGCGLLSEAPVAEVGPHQITAAALRSFVAEWSGSRPPAQTADQARRYYLQTMIDARLLLVEARSRGIDTTQAVRATVRDAIDARVRALYRAREITDAIAISAAEIRAYFDDEGYGVERKVSGILVESQTEADSLVAQLRAGQPFAEVAAAHSIDGRSARQGGELGFVGRDMAPRIHIPPEVFRTLPLGAISKPVYTGKYWNIVRFTADRPAAYDKYRDSIHRRLFAERAAQATKEHLELLQDAFEVRLHEKALQPLVTAYRRQDLSALTEQSLPLYTFDEGAITVAAAVKILQEQHIGFGFADRVQAASTLKRIVLNPFLIQEAARRAGYYEKPAIRQLKKTKDEEALLDGLKEAISRKLDLSEADVRRYYESHPEVFSHEPAVWVEEVLLPSADEAQKKRVLLERGTPFAELAGASLRSDAVEKANRFHFHPLEQAVYPKLMAALEDASEGELIGPVAVEGGFSLFRILDHEEASIEPYAQVRKRAEALLRREREHWHLQALLEKLREQYAAQIEIDEARLREAVPDSLLLR